MRKTFAASVAVLVFSLAEISLPGSTEVFAAQAPKKKKSKKKRAKKKSEVKPVEEKPVEERKKERSVVKAVDPTEEQKKKKEEEEKEAEDKIVPEEAPPMTPEQLEEKRVEEAKQKLEAERRQQSRVTPGAPSRWSNRGAMVPVASPVPVTAALPERALPIEGTVETPGQSLLGGEQQETLSARLSFGYYHLETKGQDQVFLQPTFELGSQTGVVQIVPGDDRNIDFLRARATMGYDHIAGSDFAVHLDVEYRPQIGGSRFTDYRLNEAYASYGLTDFQAPDSPWWGVALGQLAIREAGYAQALGAAARFRIVDWFRAGLFGGITGNPYGYNWYLRSTEVFQLNWYTGGAFLSFQIPELIVNVAGVVTYANVAANAAGIDRGYVYLDGAWLILPELNFVMNAWIDFLGGQVVQNVHGSLSWSPLDDLSLALGGGRFTTLLYAVSADPVKCEDAMNLQALGCSFVANGQNVEPTTGRVIAGEDGNPIVPFDSVLMTTIYNSVWVRGAYRVLGDLEVTAKFDTLIRDASEHQNALLGDATRTVSPTALRMVPGAGVRYRNPQIVDANVDLAYIIDDESQADAVISGGLGRGLFGFYLNADARYYFGTIGGLDTGVTLSYTFPRDWFPGALSLRGMFRYYRENVDVFIPIPGVTAARDDAGVISGWNTIQNQDSILGFGGIEWHL